MSDRKYIVPKWLNFVFGVLLGLWLWVVAGFLGALLMFEPPPVEIVDGTRLALVALAGSCVLLAVPASGFVLYVKVVKWNTDRKGKHRASVNSASMVVDDPWAGP